MRLDTENYSSTVIEGAVVDSAIDDFSHAANDALREGVQAAQSGDRQRARVALLRATELDHTSESAWLWLASISEYPEELMAFLGNVLEINPHNARANQWMAATKALLAKTFVQRAVDAANGGQADFAVQCLDQALENDQNNIDAWMWLAKLADSPEGKLSYFEKVIELDPDNEEALAAHSDIQRGINQALLAEARTAAVSGRRDSANDLLDAFIAENPNSEDGWILRGHLADGFAEKIDAFERVLEINPSNMAALSGLDSLKAIMALVEPAPLKPSIPFAEPAAPAENNSEAMENTACVLEAERKFEVEEVHHKSPTQDLVFPVAAAELRERMTEQPPAAEELHADAVEVVENEAAAESEASNWGMNTSTFTFNFPAGNVVEEVEEAVAEASSEEPVEIAAEYVAAVYEAVAEEVSAQPWNAPAENVVDESPVEPWNAPAQSFVDESPVEPWNAPAQSFVDESPVEPMYAESVVEAPVAVEEEEEEEEFVPVPSPMDVASGVSPVPVPESALPSKFYVSSIEDVDPGRSFVPSMSDLGSTAISEPMPDASTFVNAPVFFEQPAWSADVPPAEADAEASDEFSIPIPATFNVADTFSKTGFETTLVRAEDPSHVPSTTPCSFCRGENPSQAFTCGHCLSTLSLSDLEMLLTNTHSDKVVLRNAVKELEAVAAERPLNEKELTNLGIAYLNLRDFQTGHSHLYAASQLNPTNIVLSGQVNSLLIRLDEIRQQEEAMGAMPKEKKILVVDDSATVRKLIAGKLEKCGHEVYCAADGVEAIEALDSVLPDLILLDITMPRMDGYQVCKVIRGKDSTKNVPVVMISGKDGFFDKVRGRMAGTTGYITKPFGPETLMKAVETYLKGETLH